VQVPGVRRLLNPGCSGWKSESAQPGGLGSYRRWGEIRELEILVCTPWRHIYRRWRFTNSFGRFVACGQYTSLHWWVIPFVWNMLYRSWETKPTVRAVECWEELSKPVIRLIIHLGITRSIMVFRMSSAVSGSTGFASSDTCFSLVAEAVWPFRILFPASVVVWPLAWKWERKRSIESTSIIPRSLAGQLCRTSKILPKWIREVAGSAVDGCSTVFLIGGSNMCFSPIKFGAGSLVQYKAACMAWPGWSTQIRFAYVCMPKHRHSHSIHGPPQSDEWELIQCNCSKRMRAVAEKSVFNGNTYFCVLVDCDHWVHKYRNHPSRSEELHWYWL